MKKFCIALFLIFTILISGVMQDVVASNGKKLIDYKNELADIKNKKYANDTLKQSTLNEINQKRSEIKKSEQEIKSNENEVEQAKEKIKESEENIVKVTEELNDLLRFMQISSGQNAYLEYIANASSVTDFIKRSAVIEQLSSYQTERLEGLKQLIEEKKQLQVDLANRNKELEAKKVSLQEKVDSLDEYLDKVAKIGIDYSNQIDAQKKVIALYEKAGCKDNEYIQDCYYKKSDLVPIISDVGFRRPLARGKVNQAYRSGHGGIDLGGYGGESSYGKTVYAPAAGVVVTVSPRNKCGGNAIYIQHLINGKAYTTEFAHLSAMYVSVGQYVTSSTPIGAVGGDPSIQTWDHCTSGPHLHYSIANGYWTFSSPAQKAATTPTSMSSVTAIQNQKRWSWTTR